ncbi:hypothetical protein [Luteimonas cucumeris]|uniref:hypothetical protein n=1 Tax=Luteimonas cucumeris TaxID=985012 RepID=UPI0011A604EF|nr:hypothetical protein [Luteimonas cucumeris]
MRLTQSKVLGGLVFAHAVLGFAWQLWISRGDHGVSIPVTLVALAVLGITGAVGVLQHRRFGLYLVPLFYLAQVAQVVAPGFVLSLYLLYKVDFTIGFEFGTLGVNLLAAAMFLWSSLYAAGVLDSADALQADSRA